MRKILFISMSIPYNQVRHAGGKTFNYYINKLTEDPENEITMIAKVLPEEEKYTCTINPLIKSIFVRTPQNKLKKLWAYFKSLNSKLNPNYKYGNVLTKEIFSQITMQMKLLANNGYIPDVIILEWTWMLLFIDEVKKIFPKSKYVASEHDVSFLGAERQIDLVTGLKKKRAIKYYNALKRNELASINKCDIVFTHNYKDKQLLLENGISEQKIDTIVPYYLKKNIKREPQKGSILFYGAMNRIENSSAAIWFIKNVMPLLEDMAIHFVILGNNPPEELKKYESDKVTVTGFVDDVTPYFEEAMCLVAPLLMGAGIKVKIIEAMAMGVPVLTNDIGIEGINAKDRKEYLCCETAREYEKCIRNMINNYIELEIVGVGGKKLIESEYDLDKSFEHYADRINDLIKKNRVVDNEMKEVWYA
ncbi:MAG: glycosyltransferase [Lachnospiraceae bacterium]|nr:glycosyltransferase [Lachnospiraceae bacterium]